METNRYPNFPRYIIFDDIEKKYDIKYRRGANESLISNDLIEEWQAFFCSSKYSKPNNKQVAFFQSCTWSKPYDFSYIGKIIRNLTDKYPIIHPIIISSCGVIPYEYQLNKTFCSYDFNMDFISNPSKASSLNKMYKEMTLKRIEKYLLNNNYKIVIWYGLPTKESLTFNVKKICTKLNIPFYNLPSTKEFSKVLHIANELKDLGEIYIEENILTELEIYFEKVSKL